VAAGPGCHGYQETITWIWFCAKYNSHCLESRITKNLLTRQLQADITEFLSVSRLPGKSDATKYSNISQLVANCYKTGSSYNFFPTAGI